MRTASLKDAHPVNGILSFLDNWTTSDSRSGTFVCGGHIPITSSGTHLILDEQTRRTSPPVRIYWHKGSLARGLFQY